MKKDTPNTLSRSDVLRLRLQRAVAHSLNIFVYAFTSVWLRLIMRYRVENMRQIRKKYRKLLGKPHRATLICSNHLTLIDSFILHWAFAPWWRYLGDFSLFSWNIPEKRNYFNKLPRKLYCYIGKCIPVLRRAPKEESQKTLDKLAYLLSKGDCVTVFPEGTRSRAGRIDMENVTYGIGTILQRVPDANILCVYLRGKGQDTYSNFPKKGERFYVELDLIHTHTEFKGLRGARDLSTQVMQHLSRMEHDYFENHAPHRQ